MKRFVCIACILLACLTSCHKKLQPVQPGYSDSSGAYLGSGDSLTVNEDEYAPQKEDEHSTSIEETILQKIKELWEYTAQGINIPSSVSIEQAVLDTYPHMRRHYNYSNLGGAKLIGEMSADKSGHNDSKYNYPISINILPLTQLQFRFICSNTNIILPILDGRVTIDYAKISSGTIGSLVLDITLRNQTNTNVTISFERGQMVEAVDLHVQNVVISTHEEPVLLSPYETRTLRLPVYCASHYRNPPSGSYARLTPYVLNTPSNTFRSQRNVWNVLESNVDPNDYITFYIYRKGTVVTASGRTSPTGHAFIRIPQVGTLGFGSLHGSMFDDDGVISDHTNTIKYATDSCKIRVSKDAKKLMIKKLRELQQNVPKYRVGDYDCVSFVMDLADAGGVHYGQRIFIQTPLGFMEELKKHNYIE